MLEVLELEKTVNAEKDTWILKLPKEVCDREGFAFGTMVSLTIRNGAIQSSYIKPSAETESFLDRVIQEEGEYFKEMKRIGD
jgi:hypothetical protein